MSVLYRGLRRDESYPWRNENLGRLLLAAVDNWQRALVEGLQQAGYRDLRFAHMSLMRHIDVRGTRLTEIADRAGITKQAVGKMVAICEKLGLLVTVPDPGDGRAKIVSFTDHGRSIIIAERTVMEHIEELLASRLGASRLKELRASLSGLADADVFLDCGDQQQVDRAPPGVEEGLCG
jgi:DNA-binding MarR family transcriptional regulator